MSGAGALSGRSIMIVEDNFFVADELQRDLHNAGAEVIGPFNKVADARDSLAGNADGLSAAVLDVNIGGAKVYPLASELQSAGVPFVFVTGYDARAIPGQFAAVTRLVKPIARRELIHALAHIAR